MTISPGQEYKHYKGNTYRILAVAKHTETLEDLIVYQDTENQEKIWVRPYYLFTESVVVEGKEQPRFSLLH